MGSEQHRFAPLQQHHPPPPPPRLSGCKRWVGCWSGLSCFGRQKGGGKRIVPASRIPEANSLGNRPQVGGVNNNHTTGLAPSLLAPPSSPASFSNNNSALPSTAPSPRCYLSANSPGGPSSTMYATGPYAHETQLVSPPVFSTFTTEPSTAPFTPPPELAHLTTPSSPDVPYARFLSSVGVKSTEKTALLVSSDLQSAYSLYPDSPANYNLRSPASRATGDFLPSPSSERELPSVASQKLKYPRSDSGRLYGPDTVGNSKMSHDSNFFCPATFAEFYDQSLFPHSGGRLSVSKESDAYSNAGNGHQSRHSKSYKQEADEIEAYRASFGFSADEMITTSQYVEISDVTDESFSMVPCASDKSQGKENIQIASTEKKNQTEKAQEMMFIPQYCKSSSNDADVPGSNLKDNCSKRDPSNAYGPNTHEQPLLSDDEDIFSNIGNSRHCRKYPRGSSTSDAEVEYRRGRSLREGKGWAAWQE
ncbi:unnamed protein product [Cuscuta epithymum]|uniref:Hydroxyproline-rich glycoprotein family protein n=1 Tax=Cuscuta epithymum TaxID=186058 RepID=A0AAV0GBT0_9ASTE|nr:unnamed protein product [Cuscuta epithymum]